jgi:hypothetical protein
MTDTRSLYNITGGQLAEYIGNNATEAEGEQLRRDALALGYATVAQLLSLAEPTWDRMVEDAVKRAADSAQLDAAKWVVISDGAVMFPVLAEDFAASDMTVAELRAISDPNEYADWCSGMRMPEGMTAGSQECIDACNELIDSGARFIDIASQ